MVVQMESRVEEGLKSLGVRGDWRDKVHMVRDRFIEITQRGSPETFAFTLHNYRHSDNLIVLLGKAEGCVQVYFERMRRVFAGH